MGTEKELYTQEQIRRDHLLEDTEMVESKATLITSTDRAILVYQGRYSINKWLPKSQILEPDPIALAEAKWGEELNLIIPLWLARSNTLDYKRERRKSSD